MSQAPTETPPQLPATNTTITTPAPSTTATIPADTTLSPQNTPSSAQITYNTLSRIFAILLKVIRELLNSVDFELGKKLKCDIETFGRAWPLVKL